ncbi:hypothetical protein QUF50_03285 [Thiotrichales bacterium HSG1]|nr:hypothetical protein [Thiotrichales bacterium HSG1]
MSLIKKSFLQFKKIIPVLALSYAVIFGLLISVAIVSFYYNIPVAKFTRDPTVILLGHPFTGVISNIGILFWCSTSAICLFSSAIHIKNGNAIVSRFLFFSGLLTLLLLLDDLFTFHEAIFPMYFHIPEEAVYSGYLVLVLTFFLKFKDLIIKSEYIILLIACGFFALSILSDIFLPQIGWEFLLEDGFKLFGIVTWFIFFVRTCFIQVQGIVNG